MATTTEQPRRFTGSQQATGIASASFAKHFILAARKAQAEGDQRLAEHLVAIAYDLFDGR